MKKFNNLGPGLATYMNFCRDYFLLNADSSKQSRSWSALQICRTDQDLHYMLYAYSKTCVKRPLKNRQNKDLKLTTGSLMQVKSIAECFPWSTQQYF